MASASALARRALAGVLLPHSRESSSSACAAAAALLTTPRQSAALSFGAQPSHRSPAARSLSDQPVAARTAPSPQLVVSTPSSAGTSAAAARQPRPRPAYSAPLEAFNLPTDLLPSRVGGVVHKARLSGLARARLRKAALIAAGAAAMSGGNLAGVAAATTALDAGSGAAGAVAAAATRPAVWNAAWDRPRMSMVMKPPKRAPLHEKEVYERWGAATEVVVVAAACIPRRVTLQLDARCVTGRLLSAVRLVLCGLSVVPQFARVC